MLQARIFKKGFLNGFGRTLSKVDVDCRRIISLTSCFDILCFGFVIHRIHIMKFIKVILWSVFALPYEKCQAEV